MRDIYVAEINHQLHIVYQGINTMESSTKLIPLGFTIQKHQFVLPLPNAINVSELKRLMDQVYEAANLPMVMHETLLKLIVLRLSISSSAKFTLPTIINATLLPHQIEAIEFFHHQRCFIYAAEMGLGKTLTAIACIQKMQPTRSLIVCPASLRSNIQAECEKFTMNYKPYILKHKKNCEPLLRDHSHIIMSYSLLPSLLSSLLIYKWDMIVCDESHALKHNTSKRFKSIKRLSKNVPNMILLTGTPGYKPKEVFPLLTLVAPQYFKDFYTYQRPHGKCIPRESNKQFYFGERYMIPEIQYFGGVARFHFTKSRRLEELHALSKSFLLRQLLQDVSDLPPLLRETITIGQLTDTQAKQMSTQLNKMKLMENKHESEQLFCKCIMQTVKWKTKLLQEYVLQTCERTSDKFIVFVYHKEITDALIECLQGKIEHVIINGDTPMNQRDSILHTFQFGKPQVGILSLACCGQGLNFTFINLVLVAELVTQTEFHSQSEGRCRRIGQTKPVLMEYLILPQTTDPILWQLFQSKTNTAKHMLN